MKFLSIKYHLRLLLTLLVFIVLPTGAHAVDIGQFSIQSPISGSCESIRASGEGWQPIHRTKIPQRAHFCLRSEITIKEGELEGLSSIAISMLGASKLIWDGKLIAENGLVGTDEQSEIPGVIDFMYPLPTELSQSGEHVLVIEASNFHIKETLGVIFYYLDVVDYDATLQKPWLIALVMVGALLIISVLFLLLNVFYEWRLKYLWVSAFSLCFAILLLAEKYRAVYGYTYDFHTTRLHLVLLFSFCSCICLCGFYLFYYEYKRSVIYLFGLALLFGVTAFYVPGYDGKSAAIFFCAVVVSLLINLFAVYHKKRNALPNSLLSFGVLLVFVYSPWDFLESRFAYASFGIVGVMVASLFNEMKVNKANALTAIRLESELLKRNLQPHFLMNSLMLVVEWIEQNPKAAVSFVMALSEELRMLVKFSAMKLVPLEEEVALCKRHIEIMAYRYKADYRLEVEGQLKGISVPPAILHTQIENTFTHNRLAQDAVLKLRIMEHVDRVEIIFESPIKKKRISARSKSKSSVHEGMGVGDRYIRSRLDEIFTNRYRYGSVNEGEKWVNTLTLYKVK